MNKISKMINEMNNTQKYFLIVSKVSGLYWFIEGCDNVGTDAYSFFGKMKYFFQYSHFSPFQYNSAWYRGDDQTLAFCIMIGSLLGYFLFKDKKEGIDEKNN